MNPVIVWPALIVLAAVLAVVPTIENSGNRIFAYWLLLPPLLAGVVAACSHFPLP